MDAMVPAINMTVRALLADLLERQRSATMIRHPKLRADAEQRCRQISGWLKSGKLTAWSTPRGPSSRPMP